MTETTQPRSASARKMQIPAIRRIAANDIANSLALGLRDLRAAPLYGLAFGIVYAIGGWLILYFLFAFDLPYLAYPTAMGFALVAPFMAGGTYEISRRLEAGEPLAWYPIFCTVCQQASGIRWMALVVGFAFFIWVDWAAIIFLLFFGLKELQMDAFLSALMTLEGLYFLLLGHIAGAVMAAIVFSLTVISFPLLADRDIDFVTAMITSVNAVLANPVIMFLWALIIAALLICSILTLFVVMIPVLPVLGFASWHLYRRVIAPPEE